MSEEDVDDKTEEATPRRLQKAREEGQIPRSRELTTTAVLLASTLGLLAFGGIIARSLADVMRYNFSMEREALFDPQLMFAYLGRSFADALFALIPLISVIVVAAIAGPIALGGWLFSSKALMPKLSRMNPLSGLKRMFSAKSLVELAKSIGKVGIVIAVAFMTLKAFDTQLLGLSTEGLESGIAHALRIALWSAILISASTVVIAFVDVPYQLYDHAKKLRMSKEDIKQEYKETEGKPEVKGRIRQLQREIANRRMMSDVPKADVIITNPTHYAVALRYDPNTMETPVLLAKGVDQTAMKIREIAREHKIESLRSPVLARAIYHTTDLEGEIPQGLYLAVAQVLAYVFQLRNWRAGRGERPGTPTNIRVPPDMIFPE